MIADLRDITEDDARGVCELAGHDPAMARRFRECAEAETDGHLKNDYGRSCRNMARSYRQSLAMKARLKRAVMQDDVAVQAEAPRTPGATSRPARPGSTPSCAR